MIKAQTIKANRYAALILATGLLAGAAGPSRAASDDLNTPMFVSPAENGTQPNSAGQPAIANPGSDQLNNEAAAPPPSAAAATSGGSARVAPIVAASGEHSVWDQTSLIGKIFIGFGALLTIASAARMFMA